MIMVKPIKCKNCKTRMEGIYSEDLRKTCFQCGGMASITPVGHETDGKKKLKSKFEHINFNL